VDEEDGAIVEVVIESVVVGLLLPPVAVAIRALVELNPFVKNRRAVNCCRCDATR
jgi:hypothetical protein